MNFNIYIQKKKDSAKNIGQDSIEIRSGFLIWYPPTYDSQFLVKDEYCTVYFSLPYLGFCVDKPTSFNVTIYQ